MAEVTQADHSGWASPTLGRAYMDIERLRDALCQPVESGISEALRAVLEAIEAADYAHFAMGPCPLCTARHRTEAVKPLLDGNGFVFWGPDSGEEYSDQHPIESGEYPGAERVRQSTAQEDTLWAAFQEQFQRAEAVKPLVEALNNARERFVLALAFIGRDRGTERFDKTIDGLLKEFVNADNELLAALRSVQS